MNSNITAVNTAPPFGSSSQSKSTRSPSKISKKVLFNTADQVTLSKSASDSPNAEPVLTEEQKIAAPKAFQMMARHFPLLATFLSGEADAGMTEEEDDSDEALLEACNRQHEATSFTYQLLKLGADANVPESAEKLTPMGSAALLGNVDMMAALLRAGADINGKNGEEAFTPLQLAIESENFGAAHWLLRHGANPESKDAFKKTPLVDVVLSCNGEKSVRLAEAMLNLNANPDANYYGPLTGKKPLIVLAAALGHQEIVKLLLKKQANPNARDQMGNTALTCAVHNNDHAMIRTLLEAGADPTILAGVNMAPAP